MPEKFIRCIVRPGKVDARPMTFCGLRRLMAGACFENMDEAIQSAENNGRVLPCPACLDKAIEILTEMKKLTKE